MALCGAPFCSLTAEPAANNLSPDEIRSAFAALDAENKYTEQLTYSDLNVLPVGIKKTISNNEFAVAISNVRFYSGYAELTVFARMQIAQRKEPLFFAATGVKFSSDGGFMGDASLVLVNDVEIPVNGHTKLILKGGGLNAQNGTINKDGATSLSVDCSGFKELALNAELSFSKDFITRVTASGEPENQPVSATFAIVVNDWNNLLVELSLPRFKVNNLGDFMFQLSDVVFDFSDFRNSGSVIYPSGYEQKYMVPGIPELWRGVYAKDISVTLPKDLSNNGAPVSFSAHNLIIDDNGISGVFSAGNILPIETGNASGWAFSINRFWLELEAHNVRSGGFAGQLGLPVSEKGAYLDYSAQMVGNDRYELVVNPKDSIAFDMFMGKAVLNRNSTVTIAMDKGKFLPEANLSGYMTIDATIAGGENDTGSSKATMKDIEFRELRLRTQRPYISVASMGYSGTIQLMNLPVSVSNLEISATDDAAKLSCNVNLNLDPKFISASTGLEITGAYHMENNRGRWKHKGVSVKEVELNNCSIAGVFTLNGRLKLMNNDPTYGDGFYGEINLEFQKIVSSLKVSTSAAFGQKDGERYWFVDGYVTLPTVIPIVGVAGINGFAGGVSNGMKRVSGAGLGMSRTGCGYIPDKDMGLGIKAGVMFASTDGSLMTGEAVFEVIFNKSGGLNTIGFFGSVQFAANIPGMDNIQNSMTSLLKKAVDKENELVQGSLEKLKFLQDKKNSNPSEAAGETTDSKEKASTASIGISVGILYDLSQSTLHATFDFYVNVAGGIVRGVNGDNRAGHGVMHISPQKWYVLMGTPDERVGLQVGIPGIATLTATSYFMMGDDIPGSPAPPQKVVDILSSKGETYDYMRDLNSLGAGRGIAFGASLGFNTGDLTFLILYARFEMDAGFDVMLKDYGEAQCKGHDGPIGINGWYANGQSYFYMMGELGVKVNLAFVKARFPIIKGAAAMLLQAKLPNPTWFGGAMGVEFSVLGGKVKGKMKFEFSIGDECKIVFPGTSPIDVSMISDLTPRPNAQKLPVFTAPQLALTAAVGESFPFEDETGEKTYRISLNKFTVKDGNAELQGEIKWNREKTVATFYSHDVLPPQKQLTLDVAVGFEENVNGQWKTVYTSGQLAEERRTLNFTTDEAPDYIPKENIEYAYPLVEQKYYYPEEFKNGYVQLKRGQSYLFPTDGWAYSVQIARNEKTDKQSFGYDAANRRINYMLPDLSRSKDYSIQFLCVSTASAGETSGNRAMETVLLQEGENTVVQTGTSANEVVRSDEGKSILDYLFSSSRYRTFADKVNDMKKGAGQVEKAGSNIVGLGWELKSMPEAFETMEVFGAGNSNNIPLIYAEADLKDNYYKNDIYPILYKEYSAYPIHLMREGDAIGIPPARAFGKFLVLDGVEADRMKFPIRYELSRYYLNDYIELRNISTDKGMTSHPMYAHPFFVDIRTGNYSSVLQYILPGGERGSQVKFEYKVDRQ
jgi:hypothetical protein